jgi:flavin reductase (DIM6/NTAB) family NADH-FMN oxidoreductase RutF
VTETLTDAAADGRRLRDAYGLFATGVAIVTARDAAGARLGMTVSSFNAVSLAPPLVLFSVARSAAGFAAWAEAEHFAVHVLGAGERALSDRFARAGADKWAGLPDRPGPASGAPLIEGALATFECRTHARHPGGDHLILVGEVLAIATRRPGPPRPLLFFASCYRELADPPPASSPPEFGPLGWS